MLPGHMQYWRPCEKETYAGTKEILIDEPIHFAGPSPETPLDSDADHLATQQIEEEKKEIEPQNP